MNTIENLLFVWMKIFEDICGENYFHFLQGQN